MRIETFELERLQSVYESTVDYDLSVVGVPAFRLDELLNQEQLAELFSLQLGYGQTNGSVALREKISNMYPNANPDNILVTSGSAEANFLTNWVLFERDDNVVFVRPNYMQAWGINRGFGVFVHTVDLKPELNWQLAIDELRKQVNRETKAIILCNPNNPTGAIMKPEIVAQILEIAKEVDAWVIVDEIYRGIELNGEETPSFWGEYEKVIVTGGLSKAYGLPGLRIGWLVGPESFIYHAWSRSDYTTIAPSILSERAAQFVLEPEIRSKIFERNRTILNTNLQILQDWVKSHNGLLEFHPPQAGGMAFVRYHHAINSIDFVNQLRDEHSVLFIPGDYFSFEGYLRMGIGTQTDHLQAGLERVSKALKQLN